MASEENLLSEAKTEVYGKNVSNNDELKESVSSCEGILKTSTPRKGRCVSYLDIPNLSDDNQRMLTFSDVRKKDLRGLSQSICDLKLLTKQQMGHRQTSILFQDNFLQEQAKTLEEARMKLRALEAKYCSPQRLRSSSYSSTRYKNRRTKEGLFRTEQERLGDSGRVSSSEDEPTENNISLSSLAVDGVELSRQVGLKSLKESSDNTSDLDSASGLSSDRPPTMRIKKTRTKKRRPVTWADDEDLYSSDCNSVSCQGLSWRKLVEIIPERKELMERQCCHGYEGVQDSGNTNNLQSLQSACSTGSTHNLSHLANTREKPRWHSMPSLATNENEYNINTTMYGEAIPLDSSDEIKQNTKFGWRSGLYVVNACPEKNDKKPLLSTKNRFTKKLFHRSWSKKSSSKHITVSPPSEGQTIGKVVGRHPSLKSAYVLEINRQPSGSFGFLIQKGYREHRKGIFICRIADKRLEKFFGGLVHVGDEVLEINRTNIQEQNLVFVNKLIKSTDKLVVTLLPYLLQKAR